MDKLYYWILNRRRKQVTTTQPAVTKEIIIPVGEITDAGIIGEKVVRPEGNTPIYKEVSINDNSVQEDNNEKET